jgi:ribonuclease VapC
LILDSSVLVAMARLEPEEPAFSRVIRASSRVSISSATVLETSLVLRDSKGQAFLDKITAELRIVPFDRPQLAVARAAHRRFGRGSGHPARLNLGDCFAYALAITTGEPLLFKGDGFRHTDVTPAYVPD